MSITEQIKLSQSRINDYLKLILEQTPVTDPRLKEAIEYSLLAGGKRVRPVLTYLTGEMLNVDIADLNRIAAALECIHCFSLIHDDLPAMDDDDLRRGVPTCHIKYDEATAILAGDSLQAMAFELLSQPMSSNLSSQAQLKLIRELATATGYLGMCGGQALDIAATDSTVSLKQLEQVHKLKTGALIRAAILMPALCCDQLDEQQLEQFSSYANAIGLAFQVKDDILDIVSDTATLGKPQGSDSQANKSTYPSLMGLEGAQNKLLELNQQAMSALHQIQRNTGTLEAFTHYLIDRKH